MQTQTEIPYCPYCPYLLSYTSIEKIIYRKVWNGHVQWGQWGQQHNSSTRLRNSVPIRNRADRDNRDDRDGAL